ncbi:MAG: hypothetical protein RL172_1527 [Bacteroidota bacterium]|jgi:uncharacterized protein
MQLTSPAVQPVVPYQLLDNDFLLSPAKCLYWQQQQTLILSDLHLGKSGHFRKEGIAIPQGIFKEDLQRFVSLLQFFKPARVIIIGDMFHSHDNKEHALFVKWRADFETLPISLVMGNHDVLHQQWYQHAGIQVISQQLTEGPFSFVHDKADITTPALPGQYYFSGHIHPGISISGVGKQTVHLPCFYFGKQVAVLPAFGKFTGTYPIKPKRGETVYAVIPAHAAKKQQASIIKVF